MVAGTPSTRISGLAQWWPARTHTPSSSSTCDDVVGVDAARTGTRSRRRGDRRREGRRSCSRSSKRSSRARSVYSGELLLVGAHRVHARAPRGSRWRRRGRWPRRTAWCPPRTSTAPRWARSRRSARRVIISPPPRNGGIASSSSARAHSPPMTGRAEHLVAGEADEVGVPRLHVDRQVGDGLGGVDEHERARRVRGVGQQPDVVEGAEHVRHRGDRQQLGAVEQSVEVGEVELEVVRDRDPAQLDAALGDEDVPRNDVGVMLHLGDDHRVAGGRGSRGPTSTRRGSSPR